MQDYEQIFNDRVNTILNDSKEILIVNAGNMNSGKSSLFNALLGQNVFEVGDRRVTEKNQKEHWTDDLFLIDTPGLSASSEDDKEAIQAYDRASVIIFVHNVKNGELHRNEIESLLKIASGEKNFWSRFCLVLTNLDEYSDDNIEKITQHSLDNIKNECNAEGYPVFIVSNTRYQSGIEKGKQQLVELSGILKFRDWILQNVSRWRQEKIQRSIDQFEKAKKNILQEMQSAREVIQSRINQKSLDIQSKQNVIRRQIGDLYSDIDDLRRDYQSRIDQKNRLQQEYDRAYSAWQSSRF